jgi:hypothetical protein
MKVRSRFIILVILVLAVGFALKFAAAEDATSDKNFYVLHEDLSKITMQDCVSCHDVLNEKSLDRNIRTAHVIHAFFGEDGCLFCHKEFDTEQDPCPVLGKQVDRDICLSCHVPTEEGWKASVSSAQE